LLEAGLERRVAAELWQIVVGPGDGRDAQANGHAQTPMRCFFLPSAWSAAALRTLSRELTCGTPTSHQASPRVHCEALTLISITWVRSAFWARWNACSRSPIEETRSAMAPIDSACLAKSTPTCRTIRQCSMRLL